MLVERDCRQCVCLYVCFVCLCAVLCGHHCNCLINVVLHHLTLLTPAFVYLLVTSYVWLSWTLKAILSSPPLVTRLHPPTHKHTHTHLQWLQSTLSNFRDECQVCVWLVGKQIKEEKVWNDFMWTTEVSPVYVSLLFLSLKDVAWVWIKHKRTWWVFINRLQSCRYTVDLH